MTASTAILITGGAGFIGSNIADRLATRGSRVLIFDSLARPGVEQNLRWLIKRHPRNVETMIGDIRDRSAVDAAVARAHAVIHLAAQVAVTRSLTDPLTDFAVNAAGTLNLLEAARRRAPAPALVFASTNKVYGNLSDIRLREGRDRYEPPRRSRDAGGISERRPIDLYTPYGCSKGVADQYVLDYARHFGLRAAVLRMSCIYGPRQFGTEDQGWVAHFLLKARAGAEILLFGDGKQVRDILHVDDAVNAYLALLDGMETAAGRAFNLGGGPKNAVSLLELLSAIEGLLGRPVPRTCRPWRSGDQCWFVADTRSLTEATGWTQTIPWRDGLRQLDDWIVRNAARERPAPREAAA